MDSWYSEDSCQSLVRIGVQTIMNRRDRVENCPPFDMCDGSSKDYVRCEVTHICSLDENASRKRLRQFQRDMEDHPTLSLENKRTMMVMLHGLFKDFQDNQKTAGSTLLVQYSDLKHMASRFF